MPPTLAVLELTPLLRFGQHRESDIRWGVVFGRLMSLRKLVYDRWSPFSAVKSLAIMHDTHERTILPVLEKIQIICPEDVDDSPGANDVIDMSIPWRSILMILERRGDSFQNALRLEIVGLPLDWRYYDGEHLRKLITRGVGLKIVRQEAGLI
ncbi:hypothetical protein P691DRAFT_802573 [Macrolepiota fuliginosa MF-IS2]|uniref:Uncharacterized protein n=1 Tax=Macrolepiota fuliginosa MF-IS2 TaxID=1400762 RepID=A0A9P6C0H1_9AGAR|nr:hypothetical protein P691DRAFT_802573 [Macrolepiota fuliginosa MF-IS2]